MILHDLIALVIGMYLGLIAISIVDVLERRHDADHPEEGRDSGDEHSPER